MKTFKFYLNFASNAIISLFILLGILAAFIGISYFDERTLWSYIVVFLPLLCVLACFSLFYVNIDLKHNLSILIFVSYTTLYLINLYLEPNLAKTVFRKDTTVKMLAEKNGAKWDYRNKMQVVNDLRKVRDQVYPVFLPHFLRGGMSFVKNVPLEKQTISPLSGISKAHLLLMQILVDWIIQVVNPLKFLLLSGLMSVF